MREKKRDIEGKETRNRERNKLREGNEEGIGENGDRNKMREGGKWGSGRREEGGGRREEGHARLVHGLACQRGTVAVHHHNTKECTASTDSHARRTAENWVRA